MLIEGNWVGLVLGVGDGMRSAFFDQRFSFSV